ncbi:hypothetical protein F2Q69_00028747 [Brassica cretica]|uniref:Uncharacterized protein n=1 Tax=Brassica cretica TaxID=69181 RepID=A0A8S9S4X4_BRACR|nr:hypothetical protein F2Q69_00028747 [Brassica cretica]
MEVPSTKAVGSFDDGLRQFMGVTHELAFVFVMWSILELVFSHMGRCREIWIVFGFSVSPVALDPASTFLLVVD